MKWLLSIVAIAIACCSTAQELTVLSPYAKLVVMLSVANGKLAYRVSYHHQNFMEAAPLGLVTTLGDFTAGLQLRQSKPGRFPK
ncbi:hypothetical protein ABDK00_001255 [Niabella insulamsoli]|uniref:hypothetical protein n=1 Tax=Niabella insulamsoli TaxID=3144874 RepID=UPI0031FD4A18